jgi:hypothetical protein
MAEPLRWILHRLIAEYGAAGVKQAVDVIVSER